MSVKVDLDKLADALSDYTFAYLVTVGDDFRAHTVAVEPVLSAGGAFDVGPVGGKTRDNLMTHPAVTLVWPPSRPGGYTLIVDGHAGPSMQIVPERAVLHRPAAPGAVTRPGCKDDCRPLEK